MLKETIEKEIVTALKSGDTATLNALKSFKADDTKIAIDKRCEATDELIIDAAAKSIKQYKDALAVMCSGGPNYMDYEFRVKLLSKYLPAQLTEAEVMEIVLAAKAATGATTKKDMGKIMKEVQPKCKGKFDGKRLSEIVNSLLN